jgi:hypothetical protein
MLKCLLLSVVCDLLEVLMFYPLLRPKNDELEIGTNLEAKKQVN